MAATKISHKKILRELKRISEGIPDELLKSLLKKQTIAPTAKKLIEEAIALPDDQITPEKRAHFQNLVDSGMLDREIEVVDPDGEKAISAYYDAEIALAIKLGRLPKIAEMPAFIKKKGLKYARKQQARVKELFDSEAQAGGEEGGDN